MGSRRLVGRAGLLLTAIAAVLASVGPSSLRAAADLTPAGRVIPAPAVSATARATVAAKPPREFFGVMLDRAAGGAPPASRSEQIALMGRSGVGALRTVFSWARAQPGRDGAIDFGHTDALVAAAAAANVDLLPVVMYAPEWARLRPGRPASPPRGVATYAAYLRQLVDRYGSAGSFWAEHPELPRRPVRAWQIWNEPHLRYQWDVAARGTPWQRGYGALLKRAYRTVKSRDPHARVVLAGLTNVSWRELARLYKAGARGSFDVAAVHVYTASVANALTIVKLARTVMRRHGDRRKPIWITEVSWPAARGRADPGPGFRSVVTTDEGMAARLGSLYRRAADKRQALRLLRIYWYSWGTSYEGGDSFDYAGLGAYRDGVFTARPALDAFAQLPR
jgi:hypothetical protein